MCNCHCCEQNREKMYAYVRRLEADADAGLKMMQAVGLIDPPPEDDELDPPPVEAEPYIKRRQPAASCDTPRHAAASPAPTNIKAGEARAVIGGLLASGPKAASELVKAAGCSTATLYKHLKEGPFEKVDPNEYGSPWRLTKDGVKEFGPGKA